MSGHKKIVGLWQDTAAKADQEAEQRTLSSGADMNEANAEAPDSSVDEVAAGPGWLDPPQLADGIDMVDEDAEEVSSGSLWRDRVLPTFLMLVGAVWVGFTAYIESDALSAWPETRAVPALVASIATPLVLLCLIWMLLLRSGRSEQARFARVAANLRVENDALNHSARDVRQHLAEAQRQLAEQGRMIERLGQETVARLQESSGQIASNAELVAKAQSDLSQSGDVALQRMEGLLAGLPKIDAVAQRLADNFRQAGLVAHQQGASLEAKLATLAEEAQKTDEQTRASTTALQSALENIQSQTQRTGEEMIGTSENMVEAHETALERLTQIAQDAREHMMGMAEQIDRQMTGTFDQFTEKVAAAADQMDIRFANITATSDSFASSLLDHGLASDELTARVSGQVQAIEQKLAGLDADVAARATTIGKALDDTQTHLGRFGEQVVRGNGDAQKLVSHAESLLLALDAVTREMEETLPRSLDRMTEQSGATQTALAGLRPLLDASEMVAQSTLSHVNEVHARLTENERQLVEHGESQQEFVGKVNVALAEAESALQKLTDGADHFVGESGANMVATLQQVRGIAEEAAEQARQALDAVIKSASETMRDKAAEAIASTFKSEVMTQLSAIETASERAVSAANEAAERLMRQLITIMDTSASVEARVAEADQAISATDRDTMAKQVGLLTESLKSTAIDLTKILSSEVSDTAWEAYLKGDRGVFSRRAVKLIENSEAKEMLRIYNNDDSFRDTVNQFIHDFEAMLRVLMGARDGSAISVTLLSSDIGKLYVALAQAIDRLRN